MSSTRRLLHEHLLEAPLERGVLLDALPVLVERGRADAAQLAARQRGLQHVRRVHRALGGAGADQGVELVDEEDDLALPASISLSTAFSRSSNSSSSSRPTGSRTPTFSSTRCATSTGSHRAARRSPRVRRRRGSRAASRRFSSRDHAMSRTPRSTSTTHSAPNPPDRSQPRSAPPAGLEPAA